MGSPSVDWLGVPLKSRGRTFGVLVVQSYDPRFRYGPTEKDVLTFVSQQIAVAIDRKRAQEAVRESEERYRLLFERNLAGVYRITLTGRILECNDALAHMFGYRSREDLIDRDVRTPLPRRGPPPGVPRHPAAGTAASSTTRCAGSARTAAPSGR